MLLPASGFFDGSPLFNFVNLLIGAGGLVLTLYAMFAARRAESAAKSARTEAELARAQLQSIAAIVDLASVRQYLRESLARLEGGAFATAVVILDITRSDLAKASRSPAISRAVALSPRMWRVMDIQLSTVSTALRTIDVSAALPGKDRLDELARVLVEIDVQLAKIQRASELNAAGD